MRRSGRPEERGFSSHAGKHQLMWLVACLLLLKPASAFRTLSFARKSARLSSQKPYRALWEVNARVTARQRYPSDTLRMSAVPHGNIAVSIDTPLFPTKSAPNTKKIFWKSLTGVLASDASKIAAAAFAVALIIAVVARGSSGSSLSVFWKTIQARLVQWKEAVASTVQSSGTQLTGVPLTFNSTESDGWGVCTLRSKKRLGKSSFVQYDFDLPRADNVLQLELGQQLSLCCLDSGDSVAKGEFYMYHGEKSRLGTFSILAPNKSPGDNEYEVGKDAANFVRVLKEDLKVGDEVALKPGAQKLSYRGQYLPVTDIVYLASGVGVVPVVEQMKSILPSGSSSVKSVTVVWINEETDDFDVTAEELEQEYFKYSTKLAVSCIVDNLRSNTLEENAELTSAVPDFQPGIMGVISGPEELSRDARRYLLNRGYPDDCICVL